MATSETFHSNLQLLADRLTSLEERTRSLKGEPTGLIDRLHFMEQKLQQVKPFSFSRSLAAGGFENFRYTPFL